MEGPKGGGGLWEDGRLATRHLARWWAHRLQIPHGQLHKNNPEGIRLVLCQLVKGVPGLEGATRMEPRFLLGRETHTP